jgi:hypothetical protein
MWNFSAGEAYSYLSSLRGEEERLQAWADVPPQPQQPLLGLSQLPSPFDPVPAPKFAPDEDKKRIAELVANIKKIADRHGFENAQHRLRLFEIKLGYLILFHEFIGEIRALREGLEHDIWDRLFYCYPKVAGQELIETQDKWKSVREKFPVTSSEIFAAVDCWALGQSTASVFRLMRTAEYGLRALARERRVKLPRKQVLEWADWRTVIDEINRKVQAIANKRRGPARDAALEFYRGALGSLEGFKDAYRNNVMHTRKSYTTAEALSVMHHVREFMNRLASKMDETGKKQIKWGIK